MKRKARPQSSSTPTKSSSPEKKKSKENKSKESNESSGKLYPIKLLTDKQISTVRRYNDQLTDLDKESIQDIFRFLANGMDVTVSIKIALSSTYLVVEELFKLSKNGLVGIQSEKNLNSFRKSIEQFENSEEAISEARKRVEKVLFEKNNAFYTTLEEPTELEIGDTLFVYKRVKDGFGLQGSGIVKEISESSAFLESVESYFTFSNISKEEEFSLFLVRKKSGRKEKQIIRPSFVSKTKATILNSDSESENEEVESEPTVIKKSTLNQEEKKDSMPVGSKSDDLSSLLQIPNFVVHYEELNKENQLLKKKLAEYEKAIKTFNIAISQFVDCIDSYPEIFRIKDMVVTIGEKSLTLKQQHRSQLNKLNETQKIKFISETILEKDVKDLSEEERDLIVSIIIDIRGLSVSKDKEEIKKLRNIIRNTVCKNKKAAASSSKD